MPRARLTLAVLCLLGLVGTGAGCGGSGVPPQAQPAATPRTQHPTPTPSPSPPPQLPRGGRQLLPNYRVVAYYGSGHFPGLGVLGHGTPDQAAAAVEQQAAQYAFAGRPVQPAMELITTIADAGPGPDGDYSSPADPAEVQRYLDAARRHRMLLVLDFQPGRSDFLSQVKRYEQFLTQPDVGVALDPEWHMGPGQVPGRVIGSASASLVNDVSAHLADLVARDQLPQKLFVIHQFRLSMLPDRAAIVARPGLATVFHADGNGPIDVKQRVYAALAFPGPPFSIGFKLFFTQDPVLMTPQQVMALVPQPDLVTYQ